MKKSFFFDRDGVINEERGEYTFEIYDFRILPGIIEIMEYVKKCGYHRVVITNQSGISQGLYSREKMNACHSYFQTQSNNLVDEFYYAPDHPTVSESLSRKPDSLLFEKAIAKYELRAESSFMIGDKERDLIPARKLGISTILLGSKSSEYADFQFKDNLELLDFLRKKLPINPRN